MALSFSSKDHKGISISKNPVKENNSGSLNLKLIRNGQTIKEVQIFRAVGKGKITRIGV